LSVILKLIPDNYLIIFDLGWEKEKKEKEFD